MTNNQYWYKTDQGYKKGYERRQIVVQSELKGDRAYFFFFQDMKFLSCDPCCTLPQTLPHLKSGFQHSQMGFLIMFDKNILLKKEFCSITL